MKGLAARALYADRLSLWIFTAYGVFLLGFFFFPERPLHYKFYYVAVLLPGLFLTYKELPLLWKDWTFRLMLVWLLYQLLSGLWSQNFALAEFATLVGWWMQVLVFIVITASLVRRYPDEFDLLTRALVIGVALLALISMFSWYAKHAFPGTRLESLGRIDNPILAGCAYGSFTLLALYFAMTARSMSARILYIVAFLVLVSAVLLAQSRTATLGLLAAIVAMSLCLGRKAALATFALLVGVLVAARVIFPEVFDRFYEVLHWRPLIWKSALEHIADAPWLGHGYLSDTTVAVEGQTFQHAHSSYLGFLRDGGFVGVAIFLAMVSGLVWRIISRGCGRTGFLIPLLVFAFVVIAPDIDRLIVRPGESWLFFWWPLALFVGMNQLEPVNDETISS